MTGFRDSVEAANGGGKGSKIKSTGGHLLEKRSIAEEMEPISCPPHTRYVSREACYLVAKFVNDSQVEQARHGSMACCSFEEISRYTMNLPGNSMNDKVRSLLGRLLIVAVKEFRGSKAPPKKEDKKLAEASATPDLYAIFNSSEATPSS